MEVLTEDWDEYIKWNDALVEVLYPNLHEPLPVYLDLDDENLAKVAELVSFPGDPKSGLCAVVERVTVSRGEFSLERVVKANRVWNSEVKRLRVVRNKFSDVGEIPIPKSIAFLAVATLAALEMGSGDLSSIAYYPRLGDLLGIPRDADAYHSIERQFRRHTERLWNELNFWLELNEGSRGLPSAFSLSKRFVGIPLSQALVRKADRQKLPNFFSEFNLSPGLEMGADTISRFLDAWFNSDTCSASDSLRRLWANPATHERISEIVALELTGWDGLLHRGYRQQTNRVAAVRLMATLQRGFMGERFDLALSYRDSSGHLTNGLLEIESSDSNWMPIEFTPLAGNLWRTSSNHGLDISSVLEGAVNLRLNENSEVLASRRPRTVVPLVRDEIHGGFSEEVIMQLNVDSIILARNSRDTLEQVRKVLKEFARPGYEEKIFSELPEEWVAFIGVQLFGVPPDSMTRFKELQPISENQLTITGGVRIPSSVRKWSALAPPEIRVSIAGSKQIKLVVKDLHSGDELLSLPSDTGAIVAELSALDASPGDYLASVFLDGRTDPVRQTTIRLRSADEVDSRWNLVESLAYLLDEESNAKGVLSAVPEGLFEATSIVDGAYSEGTYGIQTDDSLTLESNWINRLENSRISQPTIRLAPVSPDSCVYTGAHRMRIETILDRRAANVQRGECLNCNLVKYYPMWPRPFNARSPRAQATVSVPTVDVASLLEVSHEGEQNWDAAIDALMHLGGGPGSALVSLAVQIDNDPLFIFNFANTLEQLGYVELQRDMDGSVKSWEISPSCLVGIALDAWQLVGHWPPESIESLGASVAELGGKMISQPESNQPTRNIVSGVSEEELMGLTLGYVIPSAGSKMLNALPRLSKLADSLPRQNMMGFNRAEYFNVDAASWEETESVERPGAFRLKRDFRSLYVFRSQSDVENQTAVISTPYLVKYLAAQLVKVSLIHYDDENQRILVPFGVELPGLYARAVTLMSGKRPLDSKVNLGSVKRNCRTYFNVSKVHAQQLQTLLLG